VSLPVELMFLGPSYGTWTWHSSAQRDIPIILYVTWNIYLMPRRTVPYVLVIRFLLCVPLFLGFAYHSYLFRNFCWFPLLLFCLFYAFIFFSHSPTRFFYLSSVYILFSSIIIYWPFTSKFPFAKPPFFSPPFSSTYLPSASSFHLSPLVAFLSLFTSIFLLLYIPVSLFQSNLKCYALILNNFRICLYFILFHLI